MATFTLDQIRDEVAKKYSPFVIEDGADEFVIPAVLQMGKKTRDKVLGNLDRVKELDESDLDGQISLIRDVLLAAVADGRGKELLSRIGDSPALLVQVFESWMEASQAGEA